ncbi:DUF4290 domain-containing protein [Hymenobacter persicinus]|uniref:DUF4290 domain-containing protein n=1 Tax=Hymenobacter persicinus TaxID=2025506 RepID=A0A4Q5L728_9BACT|nr:DUF4290 domain-containing protein [Hymenobacter persicinus]RYU76119.1 DUF4290 domain-containing protein [Hymenobacter persicinus]
MALPSPFKHELLLREYGQSTYELIQQLRTIDDRDERTKRAQQIVQLIFRLNSSLRDQPDSQQKVWNHVFEMADGELDIDAPFELHKLDILAKEPQRVAYPSKGPKLKPYGASVETMIAQALTLEDPAEREQATITIGRTMKFLYRSYSKENAKDVTILKHLKELSGGKLELDPAKVDAEGLFEFNSTATAPAASGRAAFIVPQPRADRSDRGDREMRRGNNRRDKQRRGGKKGRQEPQQPPQ